MPHTPDSSDTDSHPTHDRSLHSNDIQREKMIYLGKLTAGVAHELNNPIGYISSNVHSLEKYVDHLCSIIAVAEHKLADDSEWNDALKQHRWEYISNDVKTLLRETGEGTDHLKHVVSDLKTLGRNSLSPEYLSVNSCIHSALNVMTHQLKIHFTVQEELESLSPLLIVRPQIIQCISNLIHNAIQAHDAPGGIIRIHSFMDGNASLISIEDNGTGISEEHQKSMFIPFFTTKTSRDGTGLGLPIVAEIMKRHNGSIHYQHSEKLGGAQFILCINSCQEHSTPEAQR